jgi:predicted dehydrogenase
VGAPLDIGIVGVGRWGTNYLSRLNELDGAHLAAVCDVDPHRLAVVRARNPQVATFDDPARFFEANLDAIVVATPAESHVALAGAALTTGKHVLVEKPVALRADGADALVAAAARARRVLAVGPLSFHLRELRSAAEEVGRLQAVSARRVSLGAQHSAESALFGLVSHDLATIVGPLRLVPSRVRARSIHPVHRDQAVRVDIETVTGVSAKLEASRLGPARVRELVLHGSSGMRALDELAIERHAGTDLLTLQCRAFVDHIRSEDYSNDQARTAATVVRVLNASERSLSLSGECVELERTHDAVERA